MTAGPGSGAAPGPGGLPATPVSLILASASPRRRELLAGAGFRFDVVPSRAVERVAPGRPVPEVTVDLALAKARSVASRAAPGTVVLGADTLVVLDGRPFGKPANADDARRMLGALAGRAHEVVTGVAVVQAGASRDATAAVVSRVVMRAYAAPDIDGYLATGEPWDKAGAYAVQGEGGRLVEQVLGCYTNVIGLPIMTAARLLRAFGVTPLTGPAEPPPAPCGPR